MIHNLKMQLLMGTFMGAMMLMMLHGFLTGEANAFSWATAVFVGAHIVVVLLAVSVVSFGLTRFAWIKKITDRLHRPSTKHVLVMLLSAGFTALFIHLLHVSF
ncbi:hypothetical protein [Planktotalea sp.]|uniref:hypothetical protein n=1 Tax=Planktotalea sp. TaxID=2029877 RepID=UPI0025E13D6C|nr:hypothetical protein [Planktotalea sp.]